MVTSSTSVASTRSGPGPGRLGGDPAGLGQHVRREARRAARTRRARHRSRGRLTRVVGTGELRTPERRRRPARRPNYSQRGGAGGRSPSTVRRSRPFERPTSQAASPAAGPRTSSGSESSPSFQVSFWSVATRRSVGQPGCGAEGGHHVGDQLGQHRARDVRERRPDVEIDRVDPHLAGPGPGDVGGRDLGALPVGHPGGPGPLRHGRHHLRQPVRRGDHVVPDHRPGCAPAPASMSASRCWSLA